MDNDKFNSLAFSDDEINDELMDVLIKAGSHEYIQNSTYEIPEGELSDIEFSEELDKRLQKYISDLENEERNEKIKNIVDKTKNIMLRAAAVLLVLIVLTVGFVATSQATQIKLLNMYIEYSDISTDFEFEDPSTELPEGQEIDSLETLFRYIPDGFELIYEDHNFNNKVIIYESLNGGRIEITQMQGGSSTINSENANNYIIEVDNIPCYISEHEDTLFAVFVIDKYNYDIFTTLPLEEVIKIIQNMYH